VLLVRTLPGVDCNSEIHRLSSFAHGEDHRRDGRRLVVSQPVGEREMLSAELEFSLNKAFHQARGARHECLTVEHLLLAILDAPKVREVLEGCGADIERLAADLKQHLEGTPRLSASDEREVEPTIGFQRVLQRAVFHVQSSGKKVVSVVNVLVAIFSEKQSHAVSLLARERVTRRDVVNFVSHGLTRARGVGSSVDTGTVKLDASGLDRLTETLISLRKSMDQAATNEGRDCADSRELIDELITVARAEQPNGLKLRGLLAGLASGAAAPREVEAWAQVRDTAISLNLWIIDELA